MRLYGYQLRPVAVTLESDEDLRDALSAVGAEDHTVVRLEADLATLRRRIIEREPAGRPVGRSGSRSG